MAAVSTQRWGVVSEMETSRRELSSLASYSSTEVEGGFYQPNARGDDRRPPWPRQDLRSSEQEGVLAHMEVGCGQVPQGMRPMCSVPQRRPSAPNEIETDVNWIAVGTGQYRHHWTPPSFQKRLCLHTDRCRPLFQMGGSISAKGSHSSLCSKNVGVAADKSIWLPKANLVGQRPRIRRSAHVRVVQKPQNR